LVRIIEAESPGARDRIYPPLVTLELFVEQVIGADQACQDAVGRALSQRTALGQPACSLNTGPYCKARRRLGVGALRRIAREVAQRSEREVARPWCFRGRSVKLLDGTTVSMPDTAAHQKAFPQNSEQKPGLGFPIARMVGLISLATGCVTQWRECACEGTGNGELPQFVGLLDSLVGTDLVVADRAYCSYFLLALLRQRGVDAVFREHQSRKTDLNQAQRLGRGDDLVTWPRPLVCPDWMDAASYQAMPAQLSVRLIQDGDYSIVTTITDPRRASRDDILWLYRQRWHIELDLRSIKSVMQMDILRCKTPEMVSKEIAAHLLGYNQIRSAMARAARANDLLPRALSFASARCAFARHQERLRHRTGKVIHEIKDLLRAIAYSLLPHRPNRVGPRALKRRPRSFPLLMVPRPQARAHLLAARKRA